MTHASTVFIIDDDNAVRDSLVWLLESLGVRSLAFDSAQPFLDHFRPEMPGCLVLDMRLPGMSGMELHELLMHRGVELPTIMITGHGDVSLAVRAMKTGVIDFIEKPFSDQALLDTIRAALARDVERRQKAEDRDELRARLDQLSQRERQVLDLVVQGKLNKQIAQALGLSHKTIEVHRARVMQKMKAASLAELVKIHLKLREAASHA